MAKTITIPYALYRDNQLASINIQASHIHSARVRFRGNAQEPIFDSATNSGRHSVAYPIAPDNATQISKEASAGASVYNSSAQQQTVVFTLNTGSSSQDKTVAVDPGETVSYGDSGSADASATSASLSISAGPGIVVLDGAYVAATTHWAVPGADTVNPAVTVGGVRIQHAGPLAHGAESPWYNITVTPGNNPVSITVSGSGKVELLVEYTAEPLLPAPIKHSPEQEARISDRQPYFVFILPEEPDNSATAYHARVRVGDMSTMQDAVAYTSPDVGTWECFDGLAWQPFPAGGAPPGSQVRLKPNVLDYGTHYWDCAAHDGYDYGIDSTVWKFRVLITVLGQYHLDIGGVEYLAFAISASETSNGELGTITVTLALEEDGVNRNTAISYGDIVLLGINDSMGDTEEYKAVVRDKQPQGVVLIITAQTGDGILGERIIKEDYSAQDIGVTVRAIIATYCAPLTAVNVPDFGITAPIKAKDRTPISVLEDMRREYGLHYYVDKDWDLHMYPPSAIQPAIMTIRRGD